MKLDARTISLLDRSTVDGHLLVLPEQLEREEYLRVAKVIEALGGKWNRSAKAHFFEGDAGEAVEAAIATGEVTNRRQALGFFQTPRKLAERIVELAGVGQAGAERVLEPSAGHGAIADVVLEMIRAQKPVGLVTVEFDADNVDVMRGKGYTGTYHSDFLTCPWEDTFDGLFD
jgi:hypothetical protein